MQLVSLALIVGLLGLTYASPLEVEPIELNVVPGNYRWRVTQWQACCTSKACTYKCYVQAPANNATGIPAFKAMCQGRATGLFADCKMLSSNEPAATVEALLVPLKQPGSSGSVIVSKQMGLSLSFTNENGVCQNYTGYHQAQYNCGHHGGKYFSVQPTSNVQS